MSINCGACGTPLYHIDEACPNCLAGSRLVDRPPTYAVPPCPQCARFKAKLNREKMAKVLMEEAKTTLTPDDPWLQHTWDDVEEWERQGWLSQADAIIKHLTE